MAARTIEKLFGVFGCDAGNEMPSLRRGFAFDGARRCNTDKRSKLRPLSAVGKPVNEIDRIAMRPAPGLRGVLSDALVRA